ncbi:MAG: winged helix-turn-helix domain-containing protein [Bdellovibrionales bacterium]|nr:winged helix-turn-helix domain-containing protein [Bdellovibrionales bacterium]
MKRILIVDEDQSFRLLVKSVLTKEFEVLESVSSPEALQFIHRTFPDLILLDQSNAEMCKRLRSHPRTRSLPVLVLASADDCSTRAELSSERVRYLESGADDVLDKPFFPEELLAKVRARLRRKDSEANERAEVSLGNLRLDPVTFTVQIDGGSVVLTPTEFDLLRYFLERPGRVIPRKQLLGDLWPDAVVTRRTIDTHIANLRKKLQGFDHGFETIYGSGYRLAELGPIAAFENSTNQRY